jgi:hypothetical protein
MRAPRPPGWLTLVPFAIFFLAPAAQAAWTSDSTVNLPLCVQPYDQQLPVIVSDGVGGAIVTWQDNRASNGGHIYAQRVDATGTPRWTTNGVAIAAAAIKQVSPAIASDGAGGAVITWMTYPSGTASDIAAEHVDSTGTLHWGSTPVCIEPYNQVNPMIASDGAGGAIIVWQDGRSASYSDIYAQRISATGAALWTFDGVPVCTAVYDQTNPTIVADGAGGAFITWEDIRTLDDHDPYIQHVDSTGAFRWTVNGVQLCANFWDQLGPRVVPDGTGGAIVVWIDGRANPYTDIYAQRVNAAGVPQWTTDGVAVCTALENQTKPMMISDGAGGAIIVWTDRRNGFDADIYAQRLSAAGVPLWTANGVPVCTAAGDQLAPTITSDGAGGAILTWYDTRNGSAADIYAQRLNASGVAQWRSNGVALSSAPGYQTYPTIVGDGVGGAIVTWEDSRNGNTDVYAQNVHADGTLGGSVLAVGQPPAPVRLAVEGVWPNPSSGDFEVGFSLRDPGPARLELVDLAGRVVESRSVGDAAPGRQRIALGSRTRLAPGVYSVMIEQGGRRASARAVVLH